MTQGIKPYNTFDTFTLHCRKDRVYYAGKEFPAGYFAAEILNFAGEVQDPLLERITTLTALVDAAVASEKGRSCELLEELRPLMKDTVAWIYICPPFYEQEYQNEWDSFELAMDPERFEQDRDVSPDDVCCKRCISNASNTTDSQLICGTNEMADERKVTNGRVDLYSSRRLLHS